ncbi:hypothetical protein LXL04_025884 [Taraxacum kok-saghyz]
MFSCRCRFFLLIYRRQVEGFSWNQQSEKSPSCSTFKLKKEYEVGITEYAIDDVVEKLIDRGVDDGSIAYGYAFVDYAALRFWDGSINDDASCASCQIYIKIPRYSKKEYILEKNKNNKQYNIMGLSGGIATLWCPNKFTLTESKSELGYLLTKGIWNETKVRYGFINVYAPNDPGRKRALWEDLENIINGDSETCWMLFGDFNAVRFPSERLGSTFCPSTARYFNNFIASSGLIDVQLGGRKYTYATPDGSKHSRIDRCLITYNTSLALPNLRATVLPRLHSDHCPILISEKGVDFGPRPFRFFNSWLLESSLDEVVKAGWTVDLSSGYFSSLSPLAIVAGKLKHTKEKIKQ